MNINKLKQLRNYIAEQPEERVQMECYFYDRKNKDGDVSDPRGFERARAGDVCGTVGCIAGHACVLMPEKFLVRYRLASSLEGKVDFLASANRWLNDSYEHYYIPGVNSLALFEPAWGFERDLSGKEIALKRLDFAIAHGGEFCQNAYRTHVKSGMANAK